MGKCFCNELGYKEKAVSKQIKAKMYAEGVSQTTLASKMGITQQALSYKLNSQALTFSDLWQITKSLRFEDEEILKLFR